MRSIVALIALCTVAGLGCPAASRPPVRHSAEGAGPAPVGSVLKSESTAPSEQPAALPFTPPDQVAPDRRVYAYVDGVRRIMDIDEARSYGLTVIDLSDDWVPFIFWSSTPGKEDYQANRYMASYVQLANDKIDLDGRELKEGEHNYLEVYGIPPSLGTLRKRLLEEEQRSCYKKLDLRLFAEYHGPVRVVDRGGSLRIAKLYKAAQGDYRKALRQAGVKTLDKLLAKPQYAKIAQAYQRARWRYQVLFALQQRLLCEGLFEEKRPQLQPGIVTWAVRNALKAFEKKHNVYGWGMILPKTAEALGRNLQESYADAVKRVLSERVISAVGILEDGTAPADFTYLADDGSRKTLRNLTEEFSAALFRHLGITDAASARAFLTGYGAQDYTKLLVAVPLPKLPEYYGPHMEMNVVIDRGDVWYDLPFDETGKKLGQPRSKKPSITLYTAYKGQKIPLVHWRTTIGGWNSEMRGTQEFYKYKISDVGPRVWKNIIAGPVWVPPHVTPPKDMIKARRVGRQVQRVVGQSTFGPGYASAYGLVAAFHVREKDGFDNQIRTHGTVNYMSVYSGFSHGCHRLFNYRAVRLFSFVLRHRNFVRVGQSTLAFNHRFEHHGEEFQINLHTRGYYYELTPPVKVDVLEGRIRGKLKEPLEDYVKKPGRVYQDDLKELRGNKPIKKPATSTSMGQDQPI